MTPERYITAPATLPVTALIEAAGWQNPLLLRAALEAIAVCQDAPSPGATFPAAWLETASVVIRQRRAGASWRESVERAGLRVPSDLRDSVFALKRDIRVLEAGQVEMTRSFERGRASR